MFHKFNRILVPIDFSKNSEQTIQLAIDTFGNVAERIIVLTVSETMAQRHVMTEVDSILYEAAQTQLDTFKERFSQQSDCLEFIVKKGNAASEIITAAKDMNVDLIVMGAQGRGSLATIFFGGTTYQVSRRAHCSVFVVRDIAQTE